MQVSFPGPEDLRIWTPASASSASVASKQHLGENKQFLHGVTDVSETLAGKVSADPIDSGAKALKMGMKICKTLYCGHAA